MKATVFGALRATSLAALCAGALSTNGCCPIARKDDGRMREPVRAEAQPAPRATVRVQETRRAESRPVAKRSGGDKHCALCTGMRRGHDADGFVDGNDAAGCPDVCGPMRTGPSSACDCSDQGGMHGGMHDGMKDDCGDKSCGHDGMKSCGGGDKCCCSK
jgi:hypothetical protein